MAKTFRELVEAMNKRTPREENEENDEAKVLKPRAKGEQDFANAHGYPVDATGPQNRPSPGEGADDVLNARQTKKSEKHEPPVPGGEKSPISQGTSKLKDLSGFSGRASKTRANASAVAGDVKPVRTSKSAVKTVEGPWKNTMSDLPSISEDVISQLTSVASGKASSVKFADGETAQVNPASAKKLLNVMSKLGRENAKKFRDTVNSGTEGFLKMMNFAGSK